MNRNHLAIFHAVAQTGSISRGAEALRVSQPAVSKQVAELEDALGVRLFDRQPRGARLTDAGKLLAGYAGRFASLETEAERAIAEFRGLKRGRLALGASTTIGSYLLPDILCQFHRKRPEIELRLDIANTVTAQRLLVEEEVEIILTEGVIENDDLESKVFHQDELVAIAPPGHALARKKASLRELCREPWIMREAGSGTRAVIERALSKRKIVPQPVVSLSSTEAIKRAVMAGMGVAIVSRLALESELTAKTLAVIELCDFEIRRPLHLQQARGRSLSLAAKEFLQILGKALEQREKRGAH
jgi:DNA-binding transcriptional LysR family regulator